MQKQYFTHRKLQIRKPNARGAPSQCKTLLYYHSHIDICILINEIISNCNKSGLSSLRLSYLSDWEPWEVPSHFSVSFFLIILSPYTLNNLCICQPAIVTYIAYSPSHLSSCSLSLNYVILLLHGLSPN